jgi:CheY-like chemotaxis protein
MGKKILLADDSITIQKVIELTFSDEDFDVVTVGNGRLAIEKAPDLRPDIVLCDIIMPEKDGYEVCDFIKSHPALSHVPVLLLTGAFEPFDQERAARVGADGYLAKPFEPQTLIAKVKALLSQAGGRPARPTAVPPPKATPAAVPLSSPPPPAAPASPEPELSFIAEEPYGTGVESSVGFADVADDVVAPPPPADEGIPTFEEEFFGGPAPTPASAELPDIEAEPGFAIAEPAEGGAGVSDDLEWPVEAAPAADLVAEPQAEEAPAFEEVFEEVDAEAASPLYGESPAVEPPAPRSPAGFPEPSPPPPAAKPPTPEPAPVAAAEPRPAEPPSAAVISFADVGPAAPPEAGRESAAASIAAEVGVPADKVSQIAQRVVAQISEQVVREIAWEVIPDLAEALIKKEIDRLKGDLEKS